MTQSDDRDLIAPGEQPPSYRHHPWKVYAVALLSMLPIGFIFPEILLSYPLLAAILLSIYTQGASRLASYFGFIVLFLHCWNLGGLPIRLNRSVYNVTIDIPHLVFHLIYLGGIGASLGGSLRMLFVRRWRTAAWACLVTTLLAFIFLEMHPSLWIIPM